MTLVYLVVLPRCILWRSNEYVASKYRTSQYSMRESRTRPRKTL